MNKLNAPRPYNEVCRAKTVIKTGFIENPNTDIFNIYCDLAKSISGFKLSTFSLFDENEQCSIANSGDKNFKQGTRSPRDKFNICTYVLLNHEPLIITDIWKDPNWKTHPKVLDKTGIRGYAGFPIINKDNFALGTLCLQNPEPLKISKKNIELMKKITSNISLLLDTRIEQKEATAEKFLKTLSTFSKSYNKLTISDLECFFMKICEIDFNNDLAKNLISEGLLRKEQNGNIVFSPKGEQIKKSLDLQTKQIKRVKFRGNKANVILDEMLSEIR